MNTKQRTPVHVVSADEGIDLEIKKQKKVTPQTPRPQAESSQKRDHFAPDESPKRGLFDEDDDSPTVVDLDEVELNFQLNAKVSATRIGGSITSEGECTLREVIEAISREDHYKETILNLRKILSECGNDKKDPRFAAAKRSLDAVVIGGTFTGGIAGCWERGDFTPSGFMQIDIDDVADPAKVREELRKINYILSAFVSPSGDGVKAIACIGISQDAGDFKTRFEVVEKDMAQRGHVIDTTCKNPNRLMFASWDTEAWTRTTPAIPLKMPKAKPAAAKPAASEPASQDLVERVKEKSSMAKDLYEKGNWEFYKIKSQSEADHSLACSICEVTSQHSQQEALFRDSALYRNEYKLTRGLASARVKVAKDDERPARFSEWRDVEKSEQAETDNDFSSAKSEVTSKPFPLHCLPSIAGAMAREIVRVTTSSNEPLAVASILGIASASIGAGLEVSTGGERRTRANLFCLAIAPSGSGKGESEKLASHPFAEAEAKAIENFNTVEKPRLVAELKIAELAAKNLCAKAAKEDISTNNHSIEEFKRSEEKCAALKKKLEAAPKWKVGDATKEALAVIIAGQPGEAVASISSEARGILSIVKGRYSKEGGDEDFYCSAYSGDSLTVDRIGRDRVVIHRPCLSILWMVQPDAAEKAFGDEAFTTSGLLPRFLLFDTRAEPQERETDPDPIRAEIKAGWSKRIRTLAKTYRAAGNTPYTVEVTQDAKSLFRKYENENVRRRKSTGDLSDLASFVARWTENAWRLALVLHALKEGSNAHTRELDATTANNAIEISRWFSDQQLEVVSTRRREAHTKRLLAILAILANGMNKNMKFRELRREHRFEENEIRKLCDLWPDKLEIVKLRNGNQNPSYAVKMK